MDVVDGLIDEADAIMPALRHPDRDIVVGHPAPPADLQGLAEEILRDAGEDSADGDEAENYELFGEGVPVARFERVEEARVPGVDRDRDVDEGELGRHDAREQGPGGPAILRVEVRERQGKEGAEHPGESAHVWNSGSIDAPL